MKRKHLVLMLLALMSVSVQAQTDDMYFVPKKATKTPSTPKTEQTDRPAYYVGSNRNVDEYNRRGRFRSSYQSIGNDSVSDVINFSAGNGIYPDSAYIDTTTVYSREGYDGEMTTTATAAACSASTIGTTHGIIVMVRGIRPTVMPTGVVGTTHGITTTMAGIAPGTTATTDGVGPTIRLIIGVDGAHHIGLAP